MVCGEVAEQGPTVMCGDDPDPMSTPEPQALDPKPSRLLAVTHASTLLLPPAPGFLFHA